MRIFKSIALISAMAVILSVSAFAAAPSIISQPQNYYFPYSQTFPATAYFSVLASGDDLSYRWEYKKVNASSWTLSSTDSAYTSNYQAPVQNRSAVGDYVYRCRITGSDGQTTTTIVTTSAATGFMDTMEQMLGWTSETVDSIFDWVGSVCNCIVSEELLLFTIGFLALGGSIAILSRLLRRS